MDFLPHFGLEMALKMRFIAFLDWNLIQNDYTHVFWWIWYEQSHSFSKFQAAAKHRPKADAQIWLQIEASDQIQAFLTDIIANSCNKIDQLTLKSPFAIDLHNLEPKLAYLD